MLTRDRRSRVLICFMAVAAAAMTTTGCSSSDDKADPPETTSPAVIESSPAQSAKKPEAANPAETVKPLRDETPPATEALQTGDGDEEAFDPIKENGPIFVGWPAKAKLALVITGRQEGYMEPCGCAGLDRMKGGMSRRHSLFEQLRENGWPVVGLDVGGLAKGFGRQAEMKFHRMVDAVRKMNYGAITLGASDLKLPAGELAVDAASEEGRENPFLSANVALFGFDAELTARTRILEAGGIKLGVTGVLGRKYQQQIHNDEIELADPQAALAEVVPDLKEQANYLVLLAHASMEESIELAGEFPEFNLVVTAGGGAEPPARPLSVNGGKTLLVEVGEKGMDAVVLAMFDDPNRPIRYQRVPLDSRFPESADMKRIMTAYQDQLQQLGFENLGISVGDHAPPHRKQEISGKFVGSAKCESCHEESYRVWKKSGHAKAYQTLAELDAPRTFDPECISCHVIGWEPTGHFPYQGGYESRAATLHLVNVGCESCHGPGGAHAAAEEGADLALQEKLQKELVITKEESEKQQCRTCHDLDNSPAFEFSTYWPKIEHDEEE